MLCTKNKYLSQQIAKKFKNKHRNAFPLKSSVSRKLKKCTIRWFRKCQIKNCEYGSKKELKRLKKTHFKNCYIECEMKKEIRTSMRSKSKINKHPYCIQRYDHYDIFNVLWKEKIEETDVQSDDHLWDDWGYEMSAQQPTLRTPLIFDSLYDFEEEYHWKCNDKQQKNKYLSQKISKKFKNKHKNRKYSKRLSAKYSNPWHKKRLKKGRFNRCNKKVKKIVHKQYYNYQDLYDALDNIKELNESDTSIDEEMEEHSGYTQLCKVEKQETESYEQIATVLVTKAVTPITMINTSTADEVKQSQNSYAYIAAKTCDKPTAKIIMATDAQMYKIYVYVQSPTMHTQIGKIDDCAQYWYESDKHSHLYSFKLSRRNKRIKLVPYDRITNSKNETIAKYHQNHSFDAYVKYIEEGMSSMGIYTVHEISVLICDYIYVGCNPPMNFNTYRFGYADDDESEYKKERIECVNLPSFEDFLYYIVFNKFLTCCPVFEDCKGWGSLNWAIQDLYWRRLRITKRRIAKLDIKHNEFRIQNVETYNEKERGIFYGEIVQMIELVDLATNTNIVKMMLCELYHYSEINTDCLGPKACDIIRYSVVGKVKCYFDDKLDDYNYAYIYIEIYSEYCGKYASLEKRILRKNWIDLLHFLPRDIKWDCYSSLNELNSFMNMNKYDHFLGKKQACLVSCRVM
eukprot:231865_1